MKKNYEEPMLDVNELEVSDIVTDSGIWTPPTDED